ncbi:MAG TPA: MFS transporter, partial [Polyangiaceae bacterium]
GLALCTAAGGLAQTMAQLLVTRVFAGACGGPATALSLATIADNVPAARRGRAFGVVLSSFSLASVVGVPLGLELARLGSFRAPFLVVAALAMAIVLLAAVCLPSLTSQPPPVRQAADVRSQWQFVSDTPTLLALGSTALAMFAGFAINPNLSAFYQHNLLYPRARLGALYLGGGLIGFLGMRLGGAWVDRFGPVRVATWGSGLLVVDLWLGFVWHQPLPAVFSFCAFMLATSLRNVASSTLASRVPRPTEHGRFMSAQTGMQHAASAAGALASSAMLGERADGQLLGMDRVACLSLVAAAALPLVMARLRRQLEAPGDIVPPLAERRKR